MVCVWWWGDGLEGHAEVGERREVREREMERYGKESERGTEGEGEERKSGEERERDRGRGRERERREREGG